MTPIVVAKLRQPGHFLVTRDPALLVGTVFLRLAISDQSVRCLLKSLQRSLLVAQLRLISLRLREFIALLDAAALEDRLRQWRADAPELAGAVSATTTTN